MLLGAFSTSAFGQAADETSQDADDGRLEEVVVTGVRRKETLAMETGASLQYISGEQFKDMGIQDVEQLTFYAPGTTVNGGQIGFLSIRGIGNNSFSAGTEGSSALYVDGIYRPRITSVLTDIVDISGAEVLRGPQGTQFGRNSLGGAISVSTEAPSDEFTSEFTTWIGDYDMFRFQGGMGGPLTEGGTSGRLYVMKEERDGYIENISPVGEAPRTLDNKDVTAVRGSLRFDLGESTELVLRADWLESRDTGRVQPITSGDLRLLNQGAIIPYDDIRQTALDVEPYQNIDDTGISATFIFDLDGVRDGMTLTSLTSFREFSNLFQLDGDLTQLSAGNLIFDLDSEYVQQEFLLSFDAGDKVDGVVGLFYFHEEASFVFDIDTTLVPNTPPINLKVFQTEDIKTDAIALFTDWKWHYSPTWAFSAGLRYSWEEKSHDTQVQVGLITPPIPFSDSGLLQDTSDWDDFTPRISAEFTPSDNHLFYALVSKGFTAGNYSIGQKDPVDPEIAWNYEIGHKGTFFDGRLESSLSLYWMDLTDLQVELIGENEFDVTTPVTANIGEARNRGAEFELRALPLDWLQLSTAIAYLDAEFLKGAAVIEIPDGFQELNLDGKTPTQSPEWSTSSAVQMNFDTNVFGTEGMALIRFEHQYVDEYYAGGNNLGVLNRDADLIDSVNLFNARLQYIFPGERFSLSIVGKNLTDEVVISRLTGTEADYLIQDPDMVSQSKLPGDPRTWALVLDYRF